MSVYKEAYFALQTIEDRSRRVFEDACDFGMTMKKDDSNWKLLHGLIEMYGEKETRKLIEYGTGTSVSIDIHVMNEMDGSFDNEVFRINYVTCRGNKEMDGYAYEKRKMKQFYLLSMT